MLHELLLFVHELLVSTFSEKEGFIKLDFNVNKRSRIPMWQSKIYNLEKLETYGTQDEEKHNKNTTQYVLDNTICKQAQIT